MKFPKIFVTKREYIIHLILILVGLFLAYPIGDSLLQFQGSFSIVKMFLWFLPVLYILDNLTEWWLDI